MPKLKDAEVYDANALDQAEYDDSEFPTYTGPQPPKGTILRGFIKSLWWVLTKNEDPMIKVLFIAAENEDDEEKYNGCPIWDNVVLIDTAKFRWHPFLSNLGLTIFDVLGKKHKVYVAPDDDNVGAPIEKIASFTPGEDQEDAWIRVLTDRERYDGAWQTRLGKYLPWDEADDEQSDDEEPADETDAEEDQEEQETRRPAGRGRKAAAKKTTSGGNGRRTPGRAAPNGSARAGRSGQAGASRATRGAKAAAATPTRGRKASSQPAEGYDDEPPF